MKTKVLIVLYLFAIVAANLLVVQFGPSVVIVNAFLFIGLDITARDSLHESWRGRHLRRNMALLILAGSLISWLLNAHAARIALASCVAFGAAASVDTLVYLALGHHARYVKVNGSNVVSAAVDSVLFPALAFGFPLLYGVMLGQWIAKVSGGFIWSIILAYLGEWRNQRPATVR